MTTSTWVPLVTAGAGLIAGLAAGLVSTVLARRWASEDRRAAWQREDRLRWHADRLQVYARLISALDAWDVEMHRAVKQRKGEPFDAAGWERQARAVMELVVLVGLTAPDEVRDLALDCNSAFQRIERMLADGNADPAAILAESAGPVRATGRLMEAMRADLGLGGDGVPMARARSTTRRRQSGGRRRSPSPTPRPAGAAGSSVSAGPARRSATSWWSCCTSGARPAWSRPATTPPARPSPPT